MHARVAPGAAQRECTCLSVPPYLYDRGMEDVLLVIAAGGALFNSWQIARLSGRVDGLEATMQTVLALLAGRSSDSNAPPPR